MSHNPLVSVSCHPMLISFPVYIQAVEEFNNHADELMQMIVGTSPRMAAMAPEMAMEMKQYHEGLKEADMGKILSARGSIYFIASMYGMDSEDLRRLHSGLDIYMALTLILSKIEKKCIACLN